MNLGPTDSLGFPDILIEYIKEKHNLHLCDQRGVIFKRNIVESTLSVVRISAEPRSRSFSCTLQIVKESGYDEEEVWIGILDTVIGPYRSVSLIR